MSSRNLRAAIALMVLTTFVFAIQDAISRHLASRYDVRMVVMIRYWVFAVFVIALVSRRPGGLATALRPARPLLQIFRGVLLAGEVCIMVIAFVRLGLVETHAIFASYPLLVAALSGPILGEQVGWHRRVAIAIGFVGVLVILRPGAGVFTPSAIFPIMAALAFALYGLLTRLAAASDSTTTSFFWTGIAGAAAMSVIGIWHWEPMHPGDWVWMALLCLSAMLAHWSLIKCYDLAEASAVQPFAFLQLVFAATLGVYVFGDALHTRVVLGGAIVVGAGLYTVFRGQRA